MMDKVIYKFETQDAKLNDIETITENIDLALESLDCPLKSQTQIDIAIDEIYSNIVKHAYKDSDSVKYSKIVIEELNDPHSISVKFIDNGPQFDPLTNADTPDITASAEERQIGGLGIYMVKKSMDALSYKYENGQNIFIIGKNI